jgi:hypothetical protein
MYLCTGFITIHDKGTLAVSWRERDKEDAWSPKGHRGYDVKFGSKSHPSKSYHFYVKTLCDGRRMLVVWEMCQYPAIEYEIYDVEVVVDPEYVIDRQYQRLGVLSELNRSSRSAG